MLNFWWFSTITVLRSNDSYTNSTFTIVNLSLLQHITAK